MEEKQFLEILVKRYIDNQLDKEELEAFFYLLEQGKLDTILEQHLEDEKDVRLTRKSFQHTRNEVPIGLRIAATVVMVVGLGLAIFLNRQNIYAFLGHPYLITIETFKGEKRVVNLPDGSVIWLNESSIIEFPSKFDTDIRKVTLIEGEAYFDVKRDAAKPFNVEAGGTKTKVLGTAFNIRSYNYLHSVQVTVTRGKVEVENSATSETRPVAKILLPNEQANFNIQTKEINKVSVNSANAVAWREGRLLFDNERLADIVTILENKFEVHISFTDNTIKDYHISAEFISSDSLPHVLELLSLANNLDYEIEEKRIVISKRRKVIANQLPM